MWHLRERVDFDRAYHDGYELVDDPHNYHKHTSFSLISRGDDGVVSYRGTSNGVYASRMNNNGHISSFNAGTDYYPHCIGLSFNRIYTRNDGGTIKSISLDSYRKPSYTFTRTKPDAIALEPAYDDMTCAIRYRNGHGKVGFLDVETQIEKPTDIKYIDEVRAMQRSVWMVDDSRFLWIVDTRSSFTPFNLAESATDLIISSYYESLNACAFYADSDVPFPKEVQCRECSRKCYDYGLFDVRNCARYVLHTVTDQGYHFCC